MDTSWKCRLTPLIFDLWYYEVCYNLWIIQLQFTEWKLLILAEYVGFYSARYMNDPPYQNFLRRLKDSPETSTYQSVPDGISRIDESKFVLDMEGQFLLVFKNLAIFLPIRPAQFLGGFCGQTPSLRLTQIVTPYQFLGPYDIVLPRHESFEAQPQPS